MTTRPLLIGALCFALAPSSFAQSPAEGEPAAVSPEGYRLVWAQEFSGEGDPDPRVWGHETGFSRNRELQWYQRENARLENGMLVIEGRRKRVENPGFEAGSDDWRAKHRFAEYTSASLTTKGKHEWLYGIFEMRARFETRDGLWPAWWTLGSARPWPGCGEIDIMEYYRGMLLANACWKAEGGRWSQEWDSSRTPIDELSGSSETTDWASEFHVWRMEWTEDRVDLFVDGRLLNSIDVSTTINPDGSNPFREPHYMLVNLAIGGTQGGDPAQTEMPTRYEIDYIRVFQAEDGRD